MAAVILAAIGYGVYRIGYNQSNQLASSAGQTKISSTTKDSSTSPQPVRSATQYLVIKEWGIELPLSPAISDAYYVVATNSPDTMWLGLSSLNEGDCNASRANAVVTTISAIGALVRVTPQEIDPTGPSPNSTYEQDYPGITLGNNYYAYMSYTQNKTCTSKSSFQSINAAFIAAIKNASTISTGVSPS